MSRGILGFSSGFLRLGMVVQGSFMCMGCGLLESLAGWRGGCASQFHFGMELGTERGRRQNGRLFLWSLWTEHPAEVRIVFLDDGAGKGLGRDRGGAGNDHFPAGRKAFSVGFETLFTRGRHFGYPVCSWEARVVVFWELA